MANSKGMSVSRSRSQHACREPIRPFVCGTFKDFNVERDFLNDKIFPKLDKLCQERGTSFLPADLRWNSKQGQAAANDHVLRTCLDNVERCAPYFICLLGDRYGVHRQAESEQQDAATEEWLARNVETAAACGYDWVLEEEYRYSSLTELEVVQASFRKKYDYGYFYFRDPENLQEKIKVASSSSQKTMLLSNHQIESEYAARKLRELKQQVIDTELPVRYFKTVEELGELVLRDWQSIIRSLYAPIDPLVFKSTNTETFRQWSIHETFLETRRKIFLRTSRIREISDVLSVHAEMEQGIKRKSSMVLTHVMLSTFMTSLPGGERDSLPPVLALVGERGCGKSALVSNWLKQFGTAHPELVVISHYVGCNSSSTDVTNFMRRCTNELRLQYLGSDLGDAMDNDDITDFHRVTEAFHAALACGPSVIVIDGASEFGKSQDLPAYQAKELKWLPAKMPQSCRVIITTVKSDITFRALKERDDAYFIEISNLLDAKAKKSLLVEYVGTNCTKFMDDQHFAKISSSKLSDLPLYYVSIANEIRVFGAHKNAERQLDMYVHATTLSDLWKLIIRRWTHDYGWLRPAASRSPVPSIKAQASRDHMNSGWVADALRLLGVSRNGLTEMEMLGALKVMGYANKFSISTAYWSQLRLVAQKALVELPSGLLTFSHEVIRHVVNISLLNSLTSPSQERVILPLSEAWERQKHQCHVVVANYFLKQAISSRGTEEIPWQQLMAGNFDGLSKTVSTPGIFVKLVCNAREECHRKLDLLWYWKALKDKGMKPEELLRQMASDVHGRLSDESSGEQRVGSAVSRTEEPTTVETLCCKSEEDSFSPMEVTILLYLTGKFLKETGHHSSAEGLLLLAYKIGYPVASVHELDLLCQIQATLADLYVTMIEMGKAGHWYTNALRTAGEITRVVNKREHEAMAGHLLGQLALTRMGSDVPTGPLEDRSKSRVPSRSSRPRTISGRSRTENEGEQRLDLSVDPLLKEALKHMDLSGVFPVKSNVFFYMGLQSMKQRQWTNAKKALQTALDMRRQWYGDTHPSVAEIVDLMGTLCWNDVSESRDISEPEGLYREALRMREKALGPCHLLVASTLFKLGKLLRTKNTKDTTREAKQIFQRSLDIRTTKLGVYHNATKAVRRALMNLEAADVALTFGSSAAIKEQPMLMLRDYKEQLLARSTSKLAIKS